MHNRIIRNDILKNKAITLITTIFVAAAASLVALGCILAVNLVGAVDTLMIQSKTPHFMQMHQESLLEHDFFTNSPQELHFGGIDIEAFQVLEFLNLEGVQMQFPNGTLGDNMQDNGLSVQSEAFDFLLDLDGNIIIPKRGELYVPVCYMRDNTTEVGDTAILCGKKFTVAGFLRDSQMNSALSSSKRFLISQEDFADMKRFGTMEYLIEFRLKDMSQLSALETAYATAGLPANGPTVTYPLFKTMNAFSDGIMIGVIMLVSLLVVAVALMCIRFTLLAKIEDDYREIGVMKAIGLHKSSIQKIYLAKFAAIGFFGCVLGYIFSIILREPLSENIRIYMGESANGFMAPILAFGGVCCVFLGVIAYVNRVLRRLSKISAAEAIRFGTKQEKNAVAKYIRLSQNKLLGTNVFLGIQDVFVRKRLYATMLFVLIIASFIMMIPQNLHNTIAAKSFSTYMGIGNCDLRIDIQQTNQIAEKAADIQTAIDNDPDIGKSVLLTTKMFKTNTQENLKVELGDHTVFPVAYSQGKVPMAQGEIALSAINADELGKKVGDSITLITTEGERSLTVCGIYSDITNGGKTAKAVFTDDSSDIMWCIQNAEITTGIKDKNQSLIQDKIGEYAERFPFAKVSSIHEYIAQIFGQTIEAVKTAAYVGVVISIMITILVTLLFMKMLIAKDKYSIGVMKALGFTNTCIRNQYVTRSVFVLLVGVMLGTVLANTLGEVLAGMVISSFGATSFTFLIDPVSSYLLCPLLMIGSVLMAAILGTRGAGQIKISENIKE